MEEALRFTVNLDVNEQKSDFFFSRVQTESKTTFDKLVSM